MCSCCRGAGLMPTVRQPYSAAMNRISDPQPQPMSSSRSPPRRPSRSATKRSLRRCAASSDSSGEPYSAELYLCDSSRNSVEDPRVQVVVLVGVGGRPRARSSRRVRRPQRRQHGVGDVGRPRRRRRPARRTARCRSRARSGRPPAAPSPSRRPPPCAGRGPGSAPRPGCRSPSAAIAVTCSTISCRLVIRGPSRSCGLPLQVDAVDTVDIASSSSRRSSSDSARCCREASAEAGW